MSGKTKEHRPEADLDQRPREPSRAEDHENAAAYQGDDREARLWANHDGVELPYRAELERAFGVPLADIQVRTGVAHELQGLGARAFTSGNRIAFADAEPSKALVAHEVTHVLQNRQGGSVAPTGPQDIAPAESAAESEAEQMASMVGAGGGAKLPSVVASPGAGIQRAPKEPVVRVDRSRDAEELRTAIINVDKKTIFAVLERNANPEYMYALCRAVSPGVASSIENILTGNEWARARAYLGEQVALDRQLATHDKAAIFRDINELSDQRALDLFNAVAGPFMIAVPQPEKGDGPAPTHAPAPTTLADVQEALRSKLSTTDYTKAMRLLLDKADRALMSKPAGAVPAGTQPDDFVLTSGDIYLDPNDTSGGVLVLIGGGHLDPVSEQRVNLAEERIRAADKDGNTAQAFLSLADLDREERKALAARINAKPLVKAWDLADFASMADDATVIHSAILRAQYETTLNKKAAAGIDRDAAVARIGELVRNARLKLDFLPQDAPEAERKAAREELTRLEQLFFGDTSESLNIRGELKAATNSDPRAYAEQLSAMGADPVNVGRELLQMTNTSDADAFIAVLKLIPREHRIAALKAADRLGDISAPWFPADKRELLQAYVDQGYRSLPVDPATPTLDLTINPGSDLVLFVGPSPEATIALHEILEAMDRGPSQASWILPRLARLSEPDHKSVVTDPRFLTKLNGLPSDGDKSDTSDFKIALSKAAYSPSAAEHQIRSYPSGPGHPGQAVRLEEAKLIMEQAGGQAGLRKAYVLEAQIAENPAVAMQLTPQDLYLLDKYRTIAAIKPSLDTPQEQAMVDEISLGQPQLQDTKDGALDPNLEAEFMRVRLHKAAKIPAGTSLGEWHHDRPAVTEALSQFEALYNQARPAGVSRGDLAMLAEIYYRASHEITEWDKALAENEGLAKIAATVAGVVVAVVVTAATGGALGPLALGALAAISAGAASTIVGAAVRWEDTPGTVLTDFGTGAVEGIATVAGAGLASKIVRGSSAGLSVGRAAAKAGGTAAKNGGTVASRVAEAAIDGAFGGAAGEMFQTAVDEATWDHGVGEGLARMLGALARGAAMGAAAGGAMGGLIGGLGKLAAKQGNEVAQGVGTLLDSAGVGRTLVDDVPDAARDELGHAFKMLESGDLAEAERMIHAIDGIPAKARAMLIEAARARSAVRASGAVEAVELDGQSFWPRVVEDKEFRAIAGHQRADAIVIVENGRPQIIARRGASPSAIREEVVHLSQWHGDIAMRQKMNRISQEQLGGWSSLAPKERLERHIDKLEVEADAQRRIIQQLEHEIAEDPNAAMRVMDAEETLFLLSQRLEKLQGSRTASWLDTEALGIDELPNLYTKSAHSPQKITGWKARRARKAFIDKSIDNPKVQKDLEKQGYVIHRDARTNEIFRITRHPDHSADLPHLQLHGKTIAEGEGVSTFAERKVKAGHEWESTQKDLSELEKQLKKSGLSDSDATEIQRKIQAQGPKVRYELERRVVNGRLDEESAGIVAKWGAVAEKLESDSGGLFKLADFFKQIPAGTISEVQSDQLRRYLREQTLAYIEGLKRPKDRMEALHGMLDAQPDPGSKGELFGSYRERFMKSDEQSATYDVLDGTPEKFSGPGLQNPRTPDGAMYVNDDVAAKLPPGKYAIEDKAGDGAFKIGQAMDYAKRSYEKAGGFKLTPNAKHAEYEGLVYVFSKEAEARKALGQLEKASETRDLLGKTPAGIHVMYFNADTGELALATTVIPPKKPGTR